MLVVEKVSGSVVDDLTSTATACGCVLRSGNLLNQFPLGTASRFNHSVALADLHCECERYVVEHPQLSF